MKKEKSLKNYKKAAVKGKKNTKSSSQYITEKQVMVELENGVGNQNIIYY